MTQGYKCDRCERWHEGERARLTLKTLGKSMNADYPTDPDLCDECRKAFAEFMRGNE